MLTAKWEPLRRGYYTSSRKSETTYPGERAALSPPTSTSSRRAFSQEAPTHYVPIVGGLACGWEVHEASPSTTAAFARCVHNVD